MAGNDTHIPALGLHTLTPLDDPVMRWFVHEASLKRQLPKANDVQPSHHMLGLDLWCGDLGLRTAK